MPLNPFKIRLGRKAKHIKPQETNDTSSQILGTDVSGNSTASSTHSPTNSTSSAINVSLLPNSLSNSSLRYELTENTSMKTTPLKKPTIQNNKKKTSFEQFDFTPPDKEALKIHNKQRSNSVNAEISIHLNSHIHNACKKVDDKSISASSSTLSLDNALSQKVQRRASKTFINAAMTLAQNLAFPSSDQLSNITKSKIKVDTNEFVDTHSIVAPSLVKSTVSNEKQIIIDFSEYYDEDVKIEPGVYVYRIEVLRPELLDTSEHGQFCIADCYIILNTFLNDESKIDFNIYTWLGSEAEMDKRFCSAIYSVGLRNWIGTACRINREAQNDESPEFLVLFDNFDLQDTSFATESGLYVVTKKKYPIRLYQLVGKTTSTYLQLVEPSAASLSKKSVFLLDFGLEVIQWNGAESSLNHRSKCRMIMQRINKSERTNKASILEVDESLEPERFWEILKVKPVKVSIESLDSNDSELSEVTESSNISTNTHSMSASTSNASVEPPNSEMHIPTQRSLSCPSLNVLVTQKLSDQKLYQMIDNVSEDITSHIIHKTQLSQFHLKSEYCYVLDAGEELFFWVGDKSNSQCKAACTELLTKLLVIHTRPKWLGLHKIFDGFEPEVFKMRFSDWDRISFKKTRMVSESRSPKIKVSANALYSTPAEININAKLVERAIQHSNDTLKSISCFVFNKKTFIQLDRNELGHFHSEDSYLFLCLYKLQDTIDVHVEPLDQSKNSFASLYNPSIKVSRRNSRPVSQMSVVSIQESVILSQYDLNEPLDIEDLKKNHECVIYFWAGPKSSKQGLSTFKLKSQLEMTKVIDEMYHCPTRTVYLETGREPLAVLAHFGNSIILHSGSKLSTLKSKSPSTNSKTKQSINASLIKSTISMYQLWVDEKFKTIRAVQVNAESTSLVTRDCFLIINSTPNSANYLWMGKGTSKSEVRRIQSQIQKIISYKQDPLDLSSSMESVSQSNDPSKYQIVTENFEPDEFWALLGGYKPYATGMQYYYSLSPRFMRCACSEGFFLVDEVVFFLQSDLKSDMCVLFDGGSPKQFYIWVGADTTDLVKTLTRKSAQLWLENIDDERSMPEEQSKVLVKNVQSFNTKSNVIQPRVDGDAIWIYQDSEPLEFKAFFRGWNSSNTALIADARNTYLDLNSISKT